MLRRAAYAALLAFLAFCAWSQALGIINVLEGASQRMPQAAPEPAPSPEPVAVEMYEVVSQGKIVKSFDSLEKAVELAQSLEDSAVWNDGWAWDSRYPFSVLDSEGNPLFFKSFPEADASSVDGHVYFRRNSTLLWDATVDLADEAWVEVPVELQNPQLPRGCEVTSLSMLLQSQGVAVGKMELAEEVKKDPTPYSKKNGEIFYGNPNLGFVGRMDNAKLNGYGVYNGPIFDLLQRHLPDRAVNMTGCGFDAILYLLSQDSPVWVIINTTFKPLPESSFVTWNTSAGRIKVTYKEHSVVLTGYDEFDAYFNDPLAGPSWADKDLFKLAWEQMGSQAVSAVP
jgi:uncharacterized protein YvpB